MITVYSSGGHPETVAAYDEAGVDRVVVWLPPADEQPFWMRSIGMRAALTTP